MSDEEQKSLTDAFYVIGEKFAEIHQRLEVIENRLGIDGEQE